MKPPDIIKQYPPSAAAAKSNRWPDAAPNTLVFVQEKLRGIRGLFVSGRFYSRNGNELVKLHNTRAETDACVLAAHLPPHLYIDGELFHPAMAQQDINSAVLGKEVNALTSDIAFYPYDFTSGDRLYSQRWGLIESTLRQYKLDKVKLLRSISHINAANCSYEALLSDVISKGGEGLMIKLDHHSYIYGPNQFMYKAKGCVEEEGLCLGFKPGQGKYKGMIGSYLIKRDNGKQCYVSGMPDSMRTEPCPVGERITFRYTELNKYGNPQDPRFVAIRYHND